MSDLPPKADIRERIEHVCLVPIADDIEAPFGSTHVGCCSSMSSVARMALGCATLNTVVSNKRASAALEGRAVEFATDKVPSFVQQTSAAVLPEGSIAMSHHLDTPLASQNGQLYLDDLYVFQGNASTVFVMDVNSNITGVHVKPGFHTEARYEFKGLCHVVGVQSRWM